MNIKDFDIQINLKHEKEIKHFLGLLISTWILSYLLFNGLDYIWNIPVYKACKIVFPYLVAIPAFISFKSQGGKIRELFGGNIFLQIFIGIIIGIAMAVAVFVLSVVVDSIPVSKAYFVDAERFIYSIVYYFMVVGVAEEFIFRVCIQGYLEKHLGNLDWIAPLISAMLFSVWHFIAATPLVVAIAFVWGLIWGYAKKYMKNCTFIAVVIAHGMYDFAVPWIPYFIHI